MPTLRMDAEAQVSLLSEANHEEQQFTCFPATCPLDWRALKYCALAGFDFLFTVLMASTFKDIAVVVTFVGLSVGVLILKLAHHLHNETQQAYTKAIAECKFQEGIFVFKTGDVVVRFNRPFYHVEQEFPKGSITLLQANLKDRIVYVLYSDLARNKMTFNIDGSRLVDNPNKIANEMNRLLGLSSQQHAEQAFATESTSV